DAWQSFIQNQRNYATYLNAVDVDESFASSPQIFNAINFNVVTQQTISFPMFKAFTVGGPSPKNANLVDTPPFMPQPAESNFQTTHAILYGDTATSAVWQFLRPTRAFGADFQLLQGQADFVISPVGGGTPIPVPGPRENGFFGIASDNPNEFFNTVNFSRTTGIPNNDSFLLAFDNVSGFSINSIPEPSGITLIMTGTLALAGVYGCWRWRTRDSLTAPTQSPESKD